MSLEDYLFRYDKGAFWMAPYISSLSLFLRTFFRKNLNSIGPALKKHAQTLHSSVSLPAWLRFLFGWALYTKKLYHLWHLVPGREAQHFFFVQDFYFPLENSVEGIDLFMKETGIAPVWVCPVRGTQTAQFLSPHYGKDFFINGGFYGIPKVEASIPHLTADLEQQIYTLGGRKMLYSLTYYTEDFFSKIYDYKRYKELRKKFHAEGKLVPLYKKITNLL